MQKIINKCYIIGLILLSIALIHFSLISEIKTTVSGGIVGWNATFLQIPLLVSIFGFLTIEKTKEPNENNENTPKYLEYFGLSLLISYVFSLILSISYTTFGIDMFKVLYFTISFIIIGLIAYRKKTTKNKVKIR